MTVHPQSRIVVTGFVDGVHRLQSGENMLCSTFSMSRYVPIPPVGLPCSSNQSSHNANPIRDATDGSPTNISSAWLAVSMMLPNAGYCHWLVSRMSNQIQMSPRRCIGE